ncbi:homeobox and leucine zipper encoding b [Anabas testudineus]|uniref:Homeobox domain-containing protein n=1 Tax=Anabas testudineus TaxID=64144 RepID=A0AAQ6INM8_ANATE|nr:homeobox and leucine zipper encoding b [Anabas testudineus]
MAQIADQRLPRIKQATPDVCRETNTAPPAFYLNQNSALCLPLVSDSQRLIWVHSNQIDIQMEGAAELDKAFDRFPYLTEKQTAALAQSCSLHPDQVKVWFMLQRLRYGISWDYNDIQEVRRKLTTQQEKEKLQDRIGDETSNDRKEKRQYTEVDESHGKTVEKVRKEQSRYEGKMVGENFRTNEHSERKIKQVQLVKTVKDREVNKVEEDKGNTEQKRKRITVTDKTGKKRMKRVTEGAVERARDVGKRREQQKSVKSQTDCTRKRITRKTNKRLMSIHKWPAAKSFVVPDEPLDASPLVFSQPPAQTLDVPPLSDNVKELLESCDVFPNTLNCHMMAVNGIFEGKPETTESKLQEELFVGLTNHSVVKTDIDKLKELTKVNNPADGSSICTQQQDSHVVDPCRGHSRSRRSTKTQTQLAMLKVAFSYCQYPDSKDYDRLAVVVGIPRYLLVQWFSDMRYYIKKGRPRWMTRDQHSKALENVRYRQCLNTLTKVQTMEEI